MYLEDIYAGWLSYSQLEIFKVLMKDAAIYCFFHILKLMAKNRSCSRETHADCLINCKLLQINPTASATRETSAFLKPEG